MALNVGKLFAQLELDQRHFNTGLSSAKTNFKALGTDLARSITSMGPAGGAISNMSSALAGVGGSAAIAVAGVAAVAAGTIAAGAAAFKAASDLANMAEQLSNMRESTGLSTTTLQELKFVSENAGLSFESVANASSMVQRKLMGVEEDSGMAAKTFEKLGISTKDAQGELKSMDILFPELIRKFQNMENTTERNMLASQIFGRNIGEIAPLLGMSAAEMDKATRRARELGLVMSDKDLLKAQQLDDSIDDIKQQFRGMWMSFATSMLPVVKPAVEWIQKTLSDVWPKIRKAVGDWWIQVKPTFVEFGNVLKQVWSILGPFIKALALGIGASTKTTLQGITLALKGVRYILMAIVWVIDEIKALVNAWINQWVELIAGPKTYLQWMTLLAIQSLQAGETQSKLAKLRAREAADTAKQIAESEISAVMEILKKQKELHEEENARKRDAIGWTSVSDIWKNNMVAAMKAEFVLSGPNASELSTSDVPSPRELISILQELRKNNQKQDELRRLVADRLGVYV